MDSSQGYLSRPTGCRNDEIDYSELNSQDGLYHMTMWTSYRLALLLWPLFRIVKMIGRENIMDNNRPWEFTGKTCGDHKLTVTHILSILAGPVN